MGTVVPLRQYAQVVLNGSGAGTAKVGPLSARETWSPTSASIQCSTTVNEATCNVYAGSTATQPDYVDASFAGSSGDSTSRVSGTTIYCGQYVWAVWTGGDPGATATLTVTGSRTV